MMASIPKMKSNYWSNENLNETNIVAIHLEVTDARKSNAKSKLEVKPPSRQFLLQSLE